MSAIASLAAIMLIGRGVSDLLVHSRARRLGQSRLAELRAGASEAYFEERRELESYPSRAVTPPLWHGLLGIGLGIVLLLDFAR